ncbi:MAG: Ig-like domain-containing protein [Clostridia bacterium]|nr:Ig-like domain-containing protein [Clostridia bacterium]
MKNSRFLNKIISLVLVMAIIICSGVFSSVYAEDLADYSKLDKAIATIPDGPNRNNGVYKAEELEAIDAMVASFDRNLTSADQAVVNQYRTDLLAAINALSMDLSKAVATATVLIDRKIVKQDDIITVFIKINTNYPVTGFQLPVIYDKTQFTLVDYDPDNSNSYITFYDGSFMQGSYDLNGNAGIETGFSYTSDSEKWDTDEARAKYDYAFFTANFNSQKNPSNLNLAVPQDEVFATFRLQAKNDIENAEELVFISPDWEKTNENKAGTFSVGFSATVLNRNPLTYKSTGMTYNPVTDSMIPTDSISLNITEATLTKNNPTVQLVATVTPDTAINKKITWTSSDTSVATVDSAGKVTRVGSGEAVISAETPYGQVAACNITVLHQCFAEVVLIEATEAECYTQGNIAYYECTCGKLYSDADAKNEINETEIIIPPLNHPEDGLLEIPEVKPTHTKDGKEAYWICGYCGDSFSEIGCINKIDEPAIIPATGHDDLTDAEWSSDADSHFKKCSCGQKFEITSHTFEWKTDRDATCEDEGSRHEECIVCGYKRNENTPIGYAKHNPEFVESTDSTCTVEGNIAYYECSVCNKLFSDEICADEIKAEETMLPLKIHDFKWITENEPTCTYEGSKFEECTACGYIQNENTPIGYAKHNSEFVESTDSTCTVEGNIAYYKCAVCSKLFRDEDCTEEITPEDTVLSLTDHDYKESITLPTPVKQGYSTYTCKVCGYSYIDNYTGPGIEITGVVSTSAFESDKVRLVLTSQGETEPLQTLEITGNTATYSFKNVIKGEYTVTVSKNNHYSQSFDVSVTDQNEIKQNLIIYAYGDVNRDGKLNILDSTAVLRHVKMVELLDDESFAVADVNSNGRVTVSDYALIQRQVKGVNSIWK